jgi:hypothetical protein
MPDQVRHDGKRCLWTDTIYGNVNSFPKILATSFGLLVDEMADQVKNRSSFYKTLFVIFGLVFFLSNLIVGAALGANSNDLLRKYETGDKEFKRFEIGDRIVYFHQRMINGAIVEKDFINYQFDKNTGKLLDKKVNWRTDLPEHIAINITKGQVESMVKGEVQFSNLYIISPKSDVFPLKPTPENPCWVVRSIQDGKPIVTIIDAVTGKLLGHGIPPPNKK